MASLGNLKWHKADSVGGKAIPLSLCAGWFREISKDFEKSIYLLARHVTTGDDGLAISPPVNADRKGGAFSIKLQQFKNAIGVVIVRGQAII
mmetsp:Transcript_37661/g.80422  ORF Transcript_37661/g.80422 Transcript_37661/m.80422 type:complete len:92 (-) Transcript_37661:177-452(-)